MKLDECNLFDLVYHHQMISISNLKPKLRSQPKKEEIFNYVELHTSNFLLILKLI